MTVEETGVVDGDLLLLAGGCVDAFFDEGLGDRGDVLDGAVEPDCGVDAVG